jgi:cardiolipin synthase
LLRAGARIWRYKDGFVHAKTLVMDDAIASVGTANLDNRSLEINFEVQAFIYDEAVCGELARQFLADLDESEECILQTWQRRGLGEKMLESLGRLWSSQI